jgi:hypothetical protein
MPMKRLISSHAQTQFVFQRSFHARLFALLCLILLGCPSFSTRLYGYDAVADFSTNNNPNGVWSYGWATNATSQFQLLSNQLTVVTNADAGWWNGEALPGSCLIDQNYSGTNIIKGTVELYTNLLHMDPQSYAVFVRFTAPSNGSYQVSGLYRLTDTGTEAHNLSVVLDTNNTVYAVSTTGGVFGSQYPFSFPCLLSQGQTIDFIASKANGYGNLGTGLKATVTPLANTVATYSATANFSKTANPNGVWSYLYWTNTTFTGTPQLLMNNTYLVTGESNIFSWWTGETGPPYLGVTITGDATPNPYPETAYPNVIYYPDTLLEDPEALSAATRFTAPFSSLYTIQGFFRVQDSQLAASGYSANLEVITNSNTSSPVFVTNSLGAPLETQYPFSLSVSLNAGATVDFAVVGVNGDVFNLSSGLNATITPANPLLQFAGQSAGNFSFAFLSVNGLGYTIQSTTNLANPNWTTYSTFTGTGSLLTNQIPITGGTPCFFRISQP